MGNPVTLQPRSIRLLLLLAVGHVTLLVLMVTALYQAWRMPDLAAPAQFPALPEVPSEPTATPGPTPTALGSGGGVVFSLRRKGNADIYALDQGTRALLRLTHHPAEDRSPSWSPDGDYVAFASNRADNWDIYLLDLASGALIRLTHHPGFDANPCWSPDGKWLAFETYRNGNLDIYVMSTSGNQIHPVTTEAAADFAPAWAPDGRALTFVSWRDGSKDIHLRPFGDQAEVTNITRSPGLDEDKPAWSADGSRLAYVTGPEGQTSVHVAAFDWETLSADVTQTEFFGTGDAPAWAPDGQSLLYAHARDDRSHLVAASMAGWGLSHEVYSTDGLLDGIDWSDSSISSRVVAWAQESAGQPGGEPRSLSIYAEVVQPTPREGVPCELILLPGVSVEEGSPRLSDEVNDSFNALRRRVAEEAGWDYLAELESAWLPTRHIPPSGHSRRSFQLCGRAFALNQEPYQRDEDKIVLVREDAGNTTYWRAFLRADQQDGSLGEPLRDLPWNLNARHEGGRAEVEGGALAERIPPGYYVDFTALARDYGWEHLPSLWRWRHFWPDVLWWKYRKTGGLTWWACMLKVFEPEEIERVFGPIPRRQE